MRLQTQNRNGGRRERMRIYLLPAVLAVTAVLACAVFSVDANTRAVQNAYAVADDSAKEQINTLHVALDSGLETLEALSGSVPLALRSEGGQQELRDLLRAVCEKTSFDNLIAAGARGSVCTAYGAAPDARQTDALRTDGTSGLTYIPATGSEQPVFLLTAPVTENGQTTGAVGGVLSESYLRELLVTRAFDGAGYSFVCDGSGAVVIRTAERETQLTADSISAFAADDAEAVSVLTADFLSGTDGVVKVGTGAGARFLAYRNTGINGWMLVNVVSGNEIAAAVRVTARTAYLITGGIVAVAGLLLWMAYAGEHRRRREIETEHEDLHAAVEQSGRFVLRYEPDTDTALLLGEKWRVFGYRENEIAHFAERFISERNLTADSAATVRACFDAVRAGAQPESSDIRIPGPGGMRWYRLDCTPISDGKPRPKRHAILSLTDITDVHERENTFDQWYENLSGLVDSSVCYVEANLTRDKIERLDGVYIRGERYLRPSADGTLSAVLYADCEQHIVDEDREACRRFFDRTRLLTQFAQGVAADSTEFRSVINGEPAWHRCVLQMLRYPYSDEIKIILIYTNINDERSRIEKLSDLATRDSITHLLNREATESRIRERINSADGQDLFAMFMIDLDNFKQVNDQKGHQAGDAILREISAVIAGAFRKDDVVGRIGGDEFMVFLSHGVSRTLVEQKTALLLEAMQFSVDELSVTASIGVTISRSGVKTFEQLYAEADMALYTAKNHGKNRCHIVTEGREAEPEKQKESDAESIQLKTLLEDMDGGVVLMRVGVTGAADGPRSALSEGTDIHVTYISPSFFRSMHRSASEAADRNGLLFDVICAPDKETVFAAIRRAAAGQLSECTYRVDREGGAWRHLRAAPVRGGGTDRDATVIAVITDVTALQTSEQQRDMAMERYRVAVKHIGGMVWEVNIPTHTLTISKENAALRGTDTTVFTDAPNSVLDVGSIHPDSEADYCRLFADIYAGKESGQYAILIRDTESGYAWYRLSYELLRDADGKEHLAIGVSERITNIDSEMRAFAEETRFVEETADSVYLSAQVNLNRGTVEQLHAPGVFDSDMRQEFHRVPDAAALHGWMMEHMADPEERAECARTMLPEALIESFRRGNRWITYDARRTSHSGAPRWTNTAVNLIRHPVSGDIHAFMYLQDCDARKQWEQAYAEPVMMDPQMWVYTEDTFRRLSAFALGERTSKSLHCTLAAFEIAGLDRLAARTSAQEMGEALLTWGRLVRILADDDVIIGRMSDSRIAMFRIERDDDPDAVLSRLSQIRDKTAAVLKHTYRGELTLAIGYETEACRRASVDAMYRHAVAACYVAGRDDDRPVAAYAAEDMSLPDEHELAVLEESGTYTVLIADDNPIDRRILRHMLKTAYNVIMAENGAQALDMLSSVSDIALVLLDISMPEVDGWGVLSAMRERDMLLKTPVIIISSDGDTDHRIRALDSGAIDILTKPYEPQLVKSRVRSVIARQRSIYNAEKSRLYEMRLKQQTSLLWLAEHDELTGLLNRQAFYRRVRERLNADPVRRYRILRWDMDGFKIFNDAMGVSVGDRLLKDIAAAMQQMCGKDSIYARLEADHFVDLVPDGGRTAEQISTLVNEWFSAYTLEFKLVGRFGVYEIDDPSVEISIMCDRALLALRSIKGSYTQHIAYYDEALRQKLVEEQQLAAEMTGALARGEFEVFFQPQYNYANRSLIGAEALVRWNHPVRGILSPDTFIPLFERNGFISQLDEYVWELSCRYMRRWMDDDDRVVPISVAVNISRIDIYNPHLCENLKQLTEKYDLPPSVLKLEITESAYMESPQQLISIVEQLQKLGFIVEMDDFGSGYSSLNTLKDVPVDILKLDVRFLSESGDNARGGSILSSVVRMAHWLKLPVIAEGVETVEQADYLKSLNCFYMQGYLFGRPMPAPEFERLLREGRIDRCDRFAGAEMERMSAFWDASAQTAILFNSYVGGAAILEYRDNEVEILRANDRFYVEICTTREAYADKQRSTLSRFTSAGREAFLQMLDRTVRTRDEAEAEVESLPYAPGGQGFWTRNRTRLIAVNGDSYMFYLSTENITDRKRMEQELRQNREELQLAVGQTGRQVCRLDIPTRTLSVSPEYAKRHRIAEKLHGVPYTVKSVWEEDRTSFIAFYERIFAGEPRGETVVRFRPLQSDVIWERLDFTTVFDGDGRPVRAVISIEDVTEERRRETVLERERLFLEIMGACAIDYDVLTDTLHLQDGVPDRGIRVTDVADFRKTMDTSRYLPKESVGLLREKLAEATERATRDVIEFMVQDSRPGLRRNRLRYASIAGPDGSVHRIVGQLIDITDEYDRDRLLSELGGTERGGAANGAVIERVFSLLYESKDADAAIPDILRIIGMHYGVSRAYIFENSRDNTTCSNTYEWCADGVTPEIGTLQDISYEEDLGGTYRDNFDQSGVFFCPDIRTLPPLQRDILLRQGVRALLQCAILDDGAFAGYIGFDDCRENRHWTEEQIGTLEIVSRIVGAFLVKKRKGDEAVFSEEFCAALDGNAAYIYIIDPQDYTVTYSNRRLQTHMGRSCVGEPCYRAFLHRDTPCKQCPVRYRLEKNREEAIEVLRPDGMWVLAQASPLQSNGRRMMVVTCTDISYLKQ